MFNCDNNETVYGVWNTTAGDDITSSVAGVDVGNYYFGEIPHNVCDNNILSKYTNFGPCTSSTNTTICGLNTGFYRTLQRGPSLIIGLQVCTANSKPLRDPITITFEGSNESPSALNLGSSWILIYRGVSGLTTDPGRYSCGIPQYFHENSIRYKSYRFLVTSKRGHESSVQYSDVVFFGN